MLPKIKEKHHKFLSSQIYALHLSESLKDNHGLTPCQFQILCACWVYTQFTGVFKPSDVQGQFTFIYKRNHYYHSFNCLVKLGFLEPVEIGNSPTERQHYTITEGGCKVIISTYSDLIEMNGGIATILQDLSVTCEW